MVVLELDEISFGHDRRSVPSGSHARYGGKAGEGPTAPNHGATLTTAAVAEDRRASKRGGESRDPEGEKTDPRIVRPGRARHSNWSASTCASLPHEAAAREGTPCRSYMGRAQCVNIGVNGGDCGGVIYPGEASLIIGRAPIDPIG